ncbi:hypothetical protein BST96_03595 [Oceanicoccus sagamiensis]|uniref:Uncharacterized protein n=1 Tax=Oceanicoccus sagamiensis TaxID=716816 RepID=A0A1X9N583_9GAMM|nr:hypothetical protein BST96_03595 [Oceanicoccus sagamiensis]
MSEFSGFEHPVMVDSRAAFAYNRPPSYTGVQQPGIPFHISAFSHYGCQPWKLDGEEYKAR